jgi:hypothetical protein
VDDLNRLAPHIRCTGMCRPLLVDHEYRGLMRTSRPPHEVQHPSAGRGMTGHSVRKSEGLACSKLRLLGGLPMTWWLHWSRWAHDWSHPICSAGTGRRIDGGARHADRLAERFGLVPLTALSWVRLVGDLWLVGTHPHWATSASR